MKHRNKLVAIALVAMLTGVNVFAQLSTFLGADVDGNLPVSDLSLAKGVYQLDKKLYIPDGGSLTIAPGTVIKADVSINVNEPALIVTRGGKLFAEGTAEEPIIFTTEEDDLTGTYAAINKERWGGIILLGRAYNNIKAGDINPEGTTALGVRDGVGTIEGLFRPDTRHHYGATEFEVVGGDSIPVFRNYESSGVLRYVSIRHGGVDFDDADEINGLTLGSVGAGTVLEYIEVVSNGDDAVEFFGGTAGIKWLNMMFCEDDGLDWDQGWSGSAQFVVNVQLPTTTGIKTVAYGDNGFECDGNDKDGREVKSRPFVSNATIVGYGGSGDKGLEMKAETQGVVQNSIIVQFDIDVNFSETFWSPDSLWIENCTFDGSPNITGGEAPSLADFQANGNVFDNGILSLIDVDYSINIPSSDFPDSVYRQTVTGTLNLVPAAMDPLLEVDKNGHSSYHLYAPYRGAFEPGKLAWTAGWSSLSSLGLDPSNANLCPTDIDGSGGTGPGDLGPILGAFGTDCN